MKGPPQFNWLGISLFWIALLGLATLFFADKLAQQDNPNQHITDSNSPPGQAVILKRNRQGHYVAPGEINGYPVLFLLDTGATNIAIPEHIAEKISLKKGNKHAVMTANGATTAYRTTLNNVSLGGITLHNITASINPSMSFDKILLGMSFLKHLKLTQEGNTLTLSPPNH